MQDYDIFLLFVKVLILSSMFVVLRRFGFKILLAYSAVLLGLFLIFFYFSTKKSPQEENSKPQATTPIEISKEQQAKIDEYKNFISNGEEEYICYLGREYDQLNLLKEAFEAFTLGVEKGFNECKTDLGMFYFNGRYVQKDWTKAGELWTEAYNDDKFNETSNFNMAVYAINVYNDKQKYKYHLLKTALIDENDEETKNYLKSALLDNITATPLFLQEAVGDYYYTPELSGNKFSYGFNLYYRLTTMFDKEALWSEDYDNHQENEVKFETEYSTLRFGLKQLTLSSKLPQQQKAQNIARIISEMELLNNVLFVDRSNLEEINHFIQQTQAKLSLNQSFTQTQKLSFFETYTFIYKASYNKTNELFTFEILIDDTFAQEEMVDTLYMVLELKSLTAQANMLTITKETADFSTKRVNTIKEMINKKIHDNKERQEITEKFDALLVQIQNNAQKFEKLTTLIQNNQLQEATLLAGFPSTEVMFEKILSENKDYLTLFLDKTFFINEPKNAKIVLDILRKYQQQACINPLDLQQAQKIVLFLHNNLKIFNKEETLKLSNQKLAQLEKLSSQTLDVTSMKYWEVKDMYIQAIQNNCKKELIALIENEKHKALINVKLVVEEPLIGLKETTQNHYTPLSLAKRHQQNELVALLEKNGAKENLE